MDEDKDIEPSNESAPPQSPTRTIEEGVCPTCGYELKGQPLPGTCPECGNDYSNQAELPMRAKPSAFRICLLYGWPLVFLVLSPGGVLFNISNDPHAFAAWMFLCLIIFAVSAIINGGIMTIWLLKRHLPHDRSHLVGFNKRMGFVGGSVVSMFYIMVVAPLVIGGGCTLVMFGLVS